MFEFQRQQAIAEPLNIDDGRQGSTARSNFRKSLPRLSVILAIAIVTVVIAFVFRPVVFLNPDEQLLLETLSNKVTVNGPGMFMFTPLITRAKVRKAALLEEMDYVIVTNSLSGVQRVETGPKLLFVDAYETVAEISRKMVLQKGEYMKILDSKSGVIRVEEGPSVLVLQPTESSLEGTQKGASLKKEEYVRITDISTGSVRIERGERLVFPGPMETMEPKQSAWKLRLNEYLKLIDIATGQIRVERGEKIVFPAPTEDTRPGDGFAKVYAAVDVNEETAVLVRSKETGQVRLVQDKGLFYPESQDEILEIRKLIRVEPHEVAIVRDNAGRYDFHSGSRKGSAFFLPPHCELVTMYWGSAASPEETASHSLATGTKTVNYKVPVTKIDTRAQYAFFEYEVRTSDNVALLLEGTIFWQVVDVPTMIMKTGDPKGDVWYHARSAMIQAISQVTLKEFMEKFNNIVSNAAQIDDRFYSERGVKFHAMEVTKYQCVDPKTAAVLQEIIQETTNRINRMQKQQSDNDVLGEQMIGEIKVEKQKTALIQARSDNELMRAAIEGEADGLRLAQRTATFVANLSAAIPEKKARLDLFRFFQDQQETTKRTEHLAAGKAQLFVAPQDVNLKVNMWHQDPK
jgi:hypothetical protein